MRPWIAAIVDLVWGDNGKGRVTHDIVLRLLKLLQAILKRMPRIVVVRSLGGANAGHETVMENGVEHRRHLLGSVFEPDIPVVVGAGTVAWPRWILDEIKGALAIGIKPADILLSDLISITMPWYRLEEKLREEDLGNKKIGTTGRGIGTSFEAKARRTDSVRFYFLQRSDWPKHYQELRVAALDRLICLYGKSKTRERQLRELEQGFLADCQELLPYIVSAIRLQEIYRNADVIILEGNQGLALDYDFGTIPYVTATGTTGMMQAHAAMVPQVDSYMFVIRGGYTARVGNGPFPSEVFGEEAASLRKAGKEFGTTTGRPRRVGWFDLVMPRRALTLIGAGLLPEEKIGLALTKVDVIDEWEKIYIVNQYELDGKVIEHAPIDTETLSRCKPVLSSVKGWQQDTTGCRSYTELPEQCQAFAKRTADILNIPLRLVTCGPRPSNALFVGNDDWLRPL